MWWEAYCGLAQVVERFSKPRMWWEALDKYLKDIDTFSKPRMWWEATFANNWAVD